MKVNLAAQVFSSSVADAIEYCNEELNWNSFKAQNQQLNLLDCLMVFLTSSTHAIHVARISSHHFGLITKVSGMFSLIMHISTS